jgi:alpha-L-fucosidase
MDRQLYRKQIEEVIAKGPFQDNWESLTNFQIPNWFTKAKFGIFVHWGLFSVPAFNNEWYSRNMYVQGTPEFEHHIKTYGPHKNFGYKDFIPMFTADKFNPEEWAALFKEAGAKYIVPVAEHHDGFQMYNSNLSQWNSVNMGPKRDVIGELKQAFVKEDLVFCTSTHRAEHYWFMGNGKDYESDIKEPLSLGDFYWPSMQEQPNQQDIFATPYPSQEFLDDWLLRTCEIIDEYQPKILYFDWWIQHESFKENLQKIAAYYYNRGVEWGFPTAICYKHDALAFGSGVVDVERGKFADPKPYYWQTDTAVAHNSWCYTTSLDYKTSYDVLCYLIDVVSKNGNLLLNVGPKSDGTIPDGDRQILTDMGAWLKTNGEAVYNSKTWRVSQEGPTEEVEGQFSDGSKKTYTSKDFRFTSGNGCIYATCLKYPEDGSISISSLSDSEDQNKPRFHGIIKDVEILGFPEKINWSKDKEGLKFNTTQVKSQFPVVIKIHTN